MTKGPSLWVPGSVCSSTIHPIAVQICLRKMVDWTPFQLDDSKDWIFQSCGFQYHIKFIITYKTCVTVSPLCVGVTSSPTPWPSELTTTSGKWWKYKMKTFIFQTNCISSKSACPSLFPRALQRHWTLTACVFSSRCCSLDWLEWCHGRGRSLLWWVSSQHPLSGR